VIIEFALMARDSCRDSTRIAARWRRDISTRTFRVFNHYLQCNLLFHCKTYTVSL